VDGEPRQSWSQADEVRRVVPVLALGVAVVAVVAGTPSALDVILASVPVAAFALWTFVPGMPLWAVSLAVVVPVVVAQRSGEFEPLLFESSLLAFVAGRWVPSLTVAAPLGLLAATSPVAVGLVQDPPEIGVGVWILGIAFPWVIARALARQGQLATQLDATRSELAQQALLAERRRIARDVHDFVGHGLAAVMLQVTGARHVLRRDPAAAEEALRSAEAVGRHSLRELRRTVGLLRSEDEAGVAPPLPSARELPALVDQARSAGLLVELRMRGDLSALAPSIGVAVYRIAQEALANAARHAPHARTVLVLEPADGWVRLGAETFGRVSSRPADDTGRPRYGLIGMHERATALGGELAAGPTPEGWRVSCRIPLETDDDPPEAP
jgi:signal transduction histidine kinase